MSARGHAGSGRATTRRLVAAGIVALIATGCGAAKSATDRTVTQTRYKTQWQTITRQQTHRITKTIRLSSLPPVTTTRTESTTVTTSPRPTSQFSGNGGEMLGTIHVPRSSTLHWTNDGSYFSVTDQTDGTGIFVNSQGSSGTSAVAPGTYSDVSVNAIGNWTIRIIPN